MGFRKIVFGFLKYFPEDNIKICRILFWLDREKYMRIRGALIGENCRLEKFMLPSEPYLVEIGDNVSIGENAQFITHDGGVWVIRKIVDNPRLDFFGKVRIGNNVFIGNNTIILPNVTIGNNVIIGAGAVVSRSIPSGVVAAGVPARVLCQIDDYIHRKEKICFETKGMKRRDKRRVLQNSLNS